MVFVTDFPKDRCASPDGHEFATVCGPDPADPALPLVQQQCVFCGTLEDGRGLGPAVQAVAEPPE